MIVKNYVLMLKKNIVICEVIFIVNIDNSKLINDI